MAYAAVVSLNRTLDRILHPDRRVILHDRTQLGNLRDKLKLLQSFLEKFPRGGEAVETLTTRIRDAAYEAEDIIESQVYRFNDSSSSLFLRISDLAINSYTGGLAFLEIILPSFHIFDFGIRFRDFMFKWPCFPLKKVVEEIDSILEEGNEIRANFRVDENLQAENYFPVEGPLHRNSSVKSITIALDDDLLSIKDRLTGSDSKLDVVPIVGMGGIGKTTLAERIYSDPLIEHRFDARGWATISQSYNVRDIMLQLLKALGMLTDKILRQGDDGLAESLYKTLSGRRYLIVMDDLWSTDAWDDFRRYFPDDGNGSRIVLTTRLDSVATYAGSRLHYMKLLGNYESWKLLRTEVFGKKCPPSKLVKVGKRIALYCKGLPLAIVVIAGLLCKVNRTPEEWETVETTLHLAVNYAADACLEILSLSYNHLDPHLKACFLYFGVFPEDSSISISKVVKLWVAEGFLKENGSKTPEEVAKDCIKELAERSLISVSGKHRGKDYSRMKFITVHDLLRDVCIREAQKEKFLHVVKGDGTRIPQGMNEHRRVSFYANIDYIIGSFRRIEDILSSAKSFSSVRSILYADWFPMSSILYSGFKLLVVLDITRDIFFEFPLAVTKLYNLRYLAFPYHGEIPELICNLWNLQTLVFYPLLKTFALCPRPLPLAIWSMPQLRHLRFQSWYLSDFPCVLPGWKNTAFLPNLQTLSEISASFCTREVLQEIPNLKKLEIWMETWDAAPFYINNLDCLSHLEVLKCSIRAFGKKALFPLPRLDSPPMLAFPERLKELTLRGCRIPWKDMSMIGSLPNLRRLKLRDYAVVGPEWEPNVGEFEQLNFLYLDGSDLERWQADGGHFPGLRHLIIENCWKLEAIPSGVGDISALETIEMDNSSTTAVASALEIMKEQESYGNDSLQLYIYQVRTTST